ncbi:MAG: hypothetical protein V1248_09775, partial [Acidimicrobiales bacterium]|nr:hypothetical protein [Acidimicrobiales bacterium]MEE1570386.1 hypothetical protein [Acidimicrobiales bacterium]
RAFPRVSTILSGCGACARPRFGCRFHPVPNPFAVFGVGSIMRIGDGFVNGVRTFPQKEP